MKTQHVEVSMHVARLTVAYGAAFLALGCGDARRVPTAPDSGAPPIHSGDGGPSACQDCGDARGPIGGSCSLVDLVIAVDGSSSMTEELAAMRNDIFPAFADRLARVGKGLDNFRVATMDACPNPASYHTRGARGPCNFSSGEAWIDSSSPDLKGEFACVGDIYQDDVNCSGNNDDEQPASAAAASLESPFADGVNAGFSRRDALLVILTITDEDEQPTGSATSAQQVFDRIVATKGDVQRVVFIGIGGGGKCKGVYGSAWPSTKLKNITQKFIDQERGVWHDLCVGRLEDSLDAAFHVIEQACNELPTII